MITISTLWRFPVKSIGGESLEAATVGPFGIDGDRAFGIRDTETGNILTGRRAPALLMATARLVDGSPVITTDRGDRLDDDAALSAWLGHGVELVEADPELGGTFENPMNVEHDTDWISWTGPTGVFHDSGRTQVSLMSTASVGEWDDRRFRTNVIVDGIEAAAGEDAWVGHRLGLGDDGVEVTVGKRIDRCVMVTRPQPGLDRDLDVYRTIRDQRGNCLAVGSLVASGGRVAVGDAVTVLGPIDG